MSQAGPLGSQTQIRLRGSEANHTLVFIDGIAANDPAASGEFRFETLTSDGIHHVQAVAVDVFGFSNIIGERYFEIRNEAN